MIQRSHPGGRPQPVRRVRAELRIHIYDFRRQLVIDVQFLYLPVLICNADNVGKLGCGQSRWNGDVRY